jgi:hypothetical protein
VVDGTEGSAVAAVEVARRDVMTEKLVCILALYVATMILVKVGELVVEEEGGFEVDGDMELDDALLLIRYVKGSIASVVEVGVARGLYLDIAVSGAETVGVLVEWERGEGERRVC